MFSVTAALAALGLFLFLSDLAEPLHDQRLLLELVFCVPLLPCSARMVRARNS
jgi:hypothetical protein